MPVNLTYPGVYIQEVGSGVRTITGVATSVTAFIGRTLRGPTDQPRLVQSFAEFSRVYGGLWFDSPLSYSVQHYFLNGGRDALICRVAAGGAAASLTLPVGFSLVAASVGDWGERLRARVEDVDAEPGEAADSRFNLLVKDLATGTIERFLNLSTDPDHRRYIQRVLADSSDLVRISGSVPAARPAPSGQATPGADPLEDTASSTAFNSDGDDGAAIGDNGN